MPQNSITLGGGGEQIVLQQVTAHINITISKSPLNFERVQI